MPDELAVPLILLASSLIRAFFGFGDAVFAMPLLALVVGLTVATPLMGLVSVLVGAAVLARTWRHVDLTSVRRLVAGSVAGIPAGVLLLKRVPEGVLTKVRFIVLEPPIEPLRGCRTLPPWAPVPHPEPGSRLVPRHLYAENRHRPWVAHPEEPMRPEINRVVQEQPSSGEHFGLQA